MGCKASGDGVAVVGFCESREMSSERDHWSGRCVEWPLESAPEMKGLSSSHISPVGTVRWLSGVCGVVCGGGQSGEDQEETAHKWLPVRTYELEHTPRYLRLFPLDPKHRIVRRDPSKC